VNCSNPTGTITTAPTPTGSFTYSWSTGASSSSLVVNPTATITYSVLVTNINNGCTGLETINIVADFDPPTLVDVSPSSSTLTCNSPTILLMGSATGATSYSWSSTSSSYTSSTNQATVSADGTFTLYAIAANGCSATAIATVDPNPSSPAFTLSETTPTITCNNSAPSVSLTVTSSVTVSNFTWSPSAGISGPTNTNVATFTLSGIYSVVIMDDNGCTSTTTVSVLTDTNQPTISAATETITCSNPVATINPIYSPTSNLTYTWTGAGLTGGTNNSSATVNQSGVYSVVATNTINGCSSSATVSVVGAADIPTITVSSSSSVGISCQPGTQTVNLSASSTASNSSYLWNTGETTTAITTSVAGVYTVTIIDSDNGCSSTGTITVPNNIVLPDINANASGNLPCNQGSVTLNATSTNTNGVYNWSGPGIIGSSTLSAITGSAAGIYTVAITDTISFCTNTATIVVQQNSLVVTAGSDITSGSAPLTVNFSAVSAGATSFSWVFGDGNNSVLNNPSHTFLTAGTYTVMVTTSDGVCVASDIIVIKVESDLVVPEVITPNGDNLNDVFYVKGLEAYPNAGLQIFNRWGGQVYTSSPYKNNWDGTGNVSGAGGGKLPSGTYYIILELNDSKNTVIKSYVQLLY
jgi:gliding motility-associated-like protein